MVRKGQLLWSGLTELVRTFPSVFEDVRGSGLLLGLASMYWYAYEKDAFFMEVKNWFAWASHDPGVKQEKVFTTKR